MLLAGIEEINVMNGSTVSWPGWLGSAEKSSEGAATGLAERRAIKLLS